MKKLPKSFSGKIVTELFDTFDSEAIVMIYVMDYMNAVSERDRERLMYHLTDRYFPNGEFSPNERIRRANEAVANNLNLSI